jgi:hypothetical protein
MPLLQIQCPLALVDYNLANSPPELRHAATAFCNFLYTKEAQREFAACGFRWEGLPGGEGDWMAERDASVAMGTKERCGGF